MKKLLSAIVFIVCLSAASYAFGTSTPSTNNSPQTADKQIPG